MITRDSVESVKGNAQNARQRLGQLIEHYMNERDIDDRRVARTCSASPADVERWRKGEVVPSPDQWSKLKRSVNHAFGRFADLYQRARKEAEDESRDRAKQAMRPDTKINGALGEQLAKITEHTPPPPRPAPAPALVVVPNPEPEPARARAYKPRRQLPPGAMTDEAIARRRDFVRQLIEQRPKIRACGADSVQEALLGTFGVSMASEDIERIREEVQRSKIREEVRAEILVAPEPTPEPTAKAVVEAIVAHEAQQAEMRPGDVEAAVSLIIEALPGLQTFTIAVDEHGEASFDYQIRKVKIETVGGSGKVKR